MSGIRKRFWTILNRIGKFFRCNRNTDEENPDESPEFNFDGDYIGFDKFDSDIDYIFSDNNNGSTESYGLVGKPSDNIPIVPETDESGSEESRTVDGTAQEKSELSIKDSEVTQNPVDKKVESKIPAPDSVVIVNGQEFDIHRTLLSEASTYFREVFDGPVNKKLVLHVNSEVTTSAVFEAITTFIYDGEVQIPSKQFPNLLVSSHILGMPKLNQHCLQLLDPTTNEIQNLLNFYEVGCQLKLDRAPVLKRLANNFETLIFQDDFLEFTPEQVVEVFSQDQIGARSEVVIFLAALDWINHNFVEREEFIVQIFRCIRFTEMSMQEVVACFHPPILPGIVEMAEIKTMLLNATCYLCAKAVHQEHLFGHLKSQPRYLLLKEEFLALWDSDIFDPNYTKIIAATKIQAAFRGYQTRKQLSNDERIQT
ncbi:hypothetical protein JTE90_022544 [Oedothorax gibbosus]|uniref:BTB domain-containing protein n=1 Tax=Oedothorax gibbosus TaxID=931172 RepID=A0AAV6U614_9ARAC|nr:hypothetical protein JTE90_022544 [Oedothorax gibbosus]